MPIGGGEEGVAGLVGQLRKVGLQEEVKAVQIFLKKISNLDIEIRSR